jgi:hypothetical protein
MSAIAQNLIGQSLARESGGAALATPAVPQ